MAAAGLLAGTMVGALSACTASVGGPAGPDAALLGGASMVPLPPPPVPGEAATAVAAAPGAAAAEPISQGFVAGTYVAPLTGDATVATPGSIQPLTVAEATAAQAQPGIIPATLPDGTLLPALPAGAVVVPTSPALVASAAPAGLTVDAAAPAVIPVQAPAPAMAQTGAAVAAAVQPAIAAPLSAPAAPDGAAPLADGTPAVLPATEGVPAPAPLAPAGKADRPRRSLLASLFGNRAEPAPAAPAPEPVRLASAAPVKPVQELRNISPSATALSELPGVDTKNLFGIEQGTADEELFDDHPEEPVQLASATAAGLARLAPNGLLKQTDRVEVNCFKPELVQVLKSIERHYGKKLIVTSGYRSPKNNRRAGGSSRSMHMYCAAADVQVPGVGKWQLAKFLRSMPGRGGVGTYCHTDSVHIDIGSKRDWNWRCRRR